MCVPSARRSGIVQVAVRAGRRWKSGFPVASTATSLGILQNILLSAVCSCARRARVGHVLLDPLSLVGVCSCHLLRPSPRCRLTKCSAGLLALIIPPRPSHIDRSIDRTDGRSGTSRVPLPVLVGGIPCLVLSRFGVFPFPVFVVGQ